MFQEPCFKAFLIFICYLITQKTPFVNFCDIFYDPRLLKHSLRHTNKGEGFLFC
jgi:hypothetical protein